VNMIVPDLSARQNAPAPLARFLSVFPLPNGPLTEFPGFAFYTAAASRLYKQGSYGIRVDHAFPKNTNFFARINHAPSSRDEPMENLNVSNRDHYRIDTDSLILGGTQVFTPRLVNEFRFGASRQSTMDRINLDTSTGARNPGQIFPPGFPASDGGLVITLSPASSAFLGPVQKNRSSQYQVG